MRGGFGVEPDLVEVRSDIDFHTTNPLTILTRYRLSLALSVGAVAAAVGTGKAGMPAPIVFAFCAIWLAATGWAFLVRCSRCGLGLLLSSRQRVLLLWTDRGAMNKCSRCGQSFRE